MIDLIAKAMRQLEDQLNNQIYSDGLIEMLNQPEFAQVARVRQVIEMLQGGKGLGPLIPRVLASNGAVSVSYTHLDVYKRQQVYCHPVTRSPCNPPPLIA